jgi:FAD synthetase
MVMPKVTALPEVSKCGIWIRYISDSQFYILSLINDSIFVCHIILLTVIEYSPSISGYTKAHFTMHKFELHKIPVMQDPVIFSKLLILTGYYPKPGDLLTRVLATGTFDLLHPGHVYFLTQARALGDELFVIIARDSNVTHKPKPIVPEAQRLEMVNALQMVDKAFLGSEKDMFEPLKQIRPDIISLGYDQRFDAEFLEKEPIKRGHSAKVVRVPFSK